MSIFTNPASSSAEDARAYAAAILELLGTADPLVVLRRTAPTLHRITQRLSEEQMSMLEAPGKWSIRHVLRHFADSDLVWAWRLRLVLAQNRPVITGYDQDAWAERLHYDETPARASLEEFAAVRRGNLRLLDAASSADLQRCGVHAQRGEESVAHMMRLYAGHDLLHIRQIERIRESTGSDVQARGG
jgi:uncharacterized damage-inducible protein DinB